MHLCVPSLHGRKSAEVEVDAQGEPLPRGEKGAAVANHRGGRRKEPPPPRGATTAARPAELELPIRRRPPRSTGRMSRSALL